MKIVPLHRLVLTEKMPFKVYVYSGNNNDNENDIFRVRKCVCNKELFKAHLITYKGLTVSDYRKLKDNCYNYNPSDYCIVTEKNHHFNGWPMEFKVLKRL